MSRPAETTLLSIDIDGVLHGLDAAYAVNDSRLPAAELLAAGLFAHRQVLDDLLAEHAHVDLLVHSSWRLACDSNRIRELLGPLGHRMRGVSTPTIHDREASIKDMLRRWRVPRDRVVVLDDQPFFFRELRSNLVVCPSDAGVPAVLLELDAALRRATR